ncbi:MAG TPA: hypothetical protein VF158_15920 [Longimicrobiales bacterium]
MIAGRFFVTPHAVERFRQRIAPHLTYEQALGAIIRGLDATDSERRPAQSGTRYYIRVRRPYAFRALIVPGEGPLPAVATVLRSGKGRGGRRKRDGRRR